MLLLALIAITDLCGSGRQEFVHYKILMYLRRVLTTATRTKTQIDKLSVLN